MKILISGSFELDSLWIPGASSEFFLKARLAEELAKLSDGHQVQLSVKERISFSFHIEVDGPLDANLTATLETEVATALRDYIEPRTLELSIAPVKLINTSGSA